MQIADSLTARMAAGRYKLADLGHADLAAAQAVRDQYRDLTLDLAAAAGVVLADRYKTDRIFTLDQRDYRAIKPLTRNLKAFRILPADGDDD